jgi:hypothetical protein
VPPDQFRKRSRRHRLGWPGRACSSRVGPASLIAAVLSARNGSGKERTAVITE